MTVVTILDAKFQTLFPNAADWRNIVDAIFSHAQAYWHSPSLNTAVNFKLDETIFTTDETLILDDDNMESQLLYQL